MKNSANVLVLTILLCGTVRSYRTYYNHNFAEEPQIRPQKYPGYDRSQPYAAYKWDHGMQGHGPSESLNPPQSYDYNDKEYTRYPKEISHYPNYGCNDFKPEYGIPDHQRHRPGNGFEYPAHRPQEYWYSPGDRWTLPDPDDRHTVTRFPSWPPTSPPITTSSPISDLIRTQSCIKRCPSTPEYNPVCGSNEVTYDNPGKLECAKYCGVDVTLQRNSPCNPKTTTQSPVVTTKPPFETRPTRPTTIVGGNGATSNPLTDSPIFASTECPDGSDDCFDIDIRSRNLKPDDGIVFEDI